jgi:hypothetical protein
MKTHHLKFSGALIERGFWLYIWRVTHENEHILYVGRTGDSSSKYAASPFNRLGQHLDIRPNATANTLLKNIKAEGYNPVECEFELTSIGPLFPEQETLVEHRKYRDIIAPLEVALAEYLKGKGHKVIGTHPKPRPKNDELFNRIKSMIEGQF